MEAQGSLPAAVGGGVLFEGTVGSPAERQAGSVLVGFGLWEDLGKNLLINKERSCFGLGWASLRDWRLGFGRKEPLGLWSIRDGGD